MIEKSHTGGLWPAFYEPFRNFGARVADWLSPASDASSDDNAYRISIELPGVTDEYIDISVHEGVVTVKGEKQSRREEKGETWFFSERQYGSFSRTFRLPADADGERIEATLKSGVLMLNVPKAAPKEPEMRKVKITRS